MYLALVRERFAEWRHRMWRAAVRSAGALTMIVVALLLLGSAFAWREHKKGHFALLRAELHRSTLPRAAAAPQPGGQDAILLERPSIGGGAMPEFLSATVLPGRVMNVLQITASRFNYDDPFGREWPRDEDTGMVVLEPGRSATWRIRLEIFALT